MFSFWDCFACIWFWNMEFHEGLFIILSRTITDLMRSLNQNLYTNKQLTHYLAHTISSVLAGTHPQGSVAKGLLCACHVTATGWACWVPIVTRCTLITWLAKEPLFAQTLSIGQVTMRGRASCFTAAARLNRHYTVNLHFIIVVA